MKNTTLCGKILHFVVNYSFCGTMSHFCGTISHFVVLLWYICNIFVVFFAMGFIGYSQENNSMSNKLCLYERGHFTEPEMCCLCQKISISYNSYRYYFLVAPVGFNIDRVTTQHTPKCAENCSGNKVS